MQAWLPEPPEGTQICVGFDGSDTDDWTVLAAETRDGYSFTPRCVDGSPTIWQPKLAVDGRVSRQQVGLEVRRLFTRFKVARLYADPPRWETDVEAWALEHGEDRVIEWPTYRTRQMHDALVRFVADLVEGRIKQDGCPLTEQAMANSKMIPKAGDRYILGKPSQTQKIDPAMGRVLAHEAAADARAAGWPDEEAGPSIFFLPR